jgi:hypothetical protein
MAVAATNLTTSRSGGDATLYNTASITPGANRLILLAIGQLASSAGDAVQPTVTGCGLTWELVASRGVVGQRKVYLFRSMGAAPTTGQITIDYGAGNSQLGCDWSVVEFTGMDTSGVNGSGAIVQAASAAVNPGTGATATLAAFSSADNATFSMAAHSIQEATTPGSGFTQIATVSGSSPASSLTTAFRPDNDTTADYSWTTSTSGGVIAAEIKAAVVGGGGQTVVLGQVVGTGEVQPIIARKTRTLGQASSGAEAQPITARKRRTLGQVVTGSAAQAVQAVKRRVLGQVSTQDTAQPITYTPPTPAPGYVHLPHPLDGIVYGVSADGVVFEPVSDGTLEPYVGSMRAAGEDGLSVILGLAGPEAFSGVTEPNEASGDVEPSVAGGVVSPAAQDGTIT